MAIDDTVKAEKILADMLQWDEEYAAILAAMTPCQRAKAIVEDFVNEQLFEEQLEKNIH